MKLSREIKLGYTIDKNPEENNHIIFVGTVFAFFINRFVAYKK